MSQLPSWRVAVHVNLVTWQIFMRFKHSSQHPKFERCHEGMGSRPTAPPPRPSHPKLIVCHGGGGGVDVAMGTKNWILKCPVLVLQVACGWWACYIFPPCPLVVGQLNPLRPKKYHHGLGLARKLRDLIVWFGSQPIIRVQVVANHCSSVGWILLIFCQFYYTHVSSVVCTWIFGCAIHATLQSGSKPPCFVLFNKLCFCFLAAKKERQQERKKGRKRSIFPFSHWFLDLGLSYTQLKPCSSPTHSGFTRVGKYMSSSWCGDWFWCVGSTCKQLVKKHYLQASQTFMGLFCPHPLPQSKSLLCTSQYLLCMT